MAHKSAHNKENLLKFTWKHVQCFINMLFVPILVSYGFEKTFIPSFSFIDHFTLHDWFCGQKFLKY